MTTARSAVSDAVLTRDKMRALGVSTCTATLRYDDSIEKTTLTPAQHAALRDQAAALEASASSIMIRVPAAQQDAPADTIAIAREWEPPLWCDDIALRQQGRLRGVPAFSLLDLITELTRQGTPSAPGPCCGASPVTSSSTSRSAPATSLRSPHPAAGAPAPPAPPSHGPHGGGPRRQTGPA